MELVVDGRHHDGPAMAALQQKERAFVLAMVTTIGADGTPDPNRAALTAGYKQGIYGYELMRKPKILEALREEGEKKLRGAITLGINKLVEIAETNGHKDQYQAVKLLVGLNDFNPAQKVDVNHAGAVEHIHIDAKERVERLAIRMGKTPQQVLDMLGVKVIDAEFEVVSSPDEWTVP